MGFYSDRLETEVRLEWMRPEEVAAAKERCPAIYVPFGSLEWHGYHNVVGLDTLKAHEQLVGLAARAGGVVYPPVYFGAGGGMEVMALVENQAPDVAGDHAAKYETGLHFLRNYARLCSQNR